MKLRPCYVRLAVMIGLIAAGVCAVAPARAQLLSEDFDSAFPPVGWIATSVTEGVVDWWVTADESANWTSATPGRGLAAVADAQWTEDAYDVSLISPVVAVPDGQAAVLTFVTLLETWTGLETADIDVRPVGAGDWTNVARWTHADLVAGSLEGPVAVGLGGYGGQSVEFRFRYYNDLSGLPDGAVFFGDLYWQIDDVRVDVAIPGDADLDGDVDLDDFVVLKQNFTMTGMTWAEGDFTGDGTVDLDDFVLLKQNFTTGALY